MMNQPEIPIAKAVMVLEKNIREIDRVSEWAEVCNYKNTKLFSRHYRNEFGVRPISTIKNIKLRIAIKLLKRAELSNYEIALEIGKKDDQALYHFIKQQTGNSPEFYKKKKVRVNKKSKK